MITRIVIATALSALSVSCYANKVDLSIMGGGTLSNSSNRSTVQINNVVTNYYKPSSNNTIGSLAGIGVGHTFENIFNRPFNFSIGLSAYYADLDKVRGTEYPFANGGNFDTLDYQFNVKSSSVMLEPRFIYSHCAWQPYLLAGVGIAWNRLDNYQEQPSNPALSAAPAPFYKSNTRSSFAYEAGIGVQHSLFHDQKHNVDYLASLDYRYMNFGAGRLVNFPGMTSNDYLGVPNINLQALMLSLKASF